MLEPDTTDFLGKRTTSWVSEIFQKRRFCKPEYTLCYGKSQNSVASKIKVINYDGHTFEMFGPDARNTQLAHALASTKLLGMLGITKSILVDLSNNLKPVWPKYEPSADEKIKIGSQTEELEEEFGKGDETYRNKYGSVWLDDFVRKAKLDPPEFELTKVEGYFVATMTLQVNGQEFKGTGVPKKRIKLARHSASLHLLTKLGFNKSNLFRVQMAKFSYPDILFVEIPTEQHVHEPPTPPVSSTIINPQDCVPLPKPKKRSKKVHFVEPPHELFKGAAKNLESGNGATMSGASGNKQITGILKNPGPSTQEIDYGFKKETQVEQAMRYQRQSRGILTEQEKRPSDVGLYLMQEIDGLMKRHGYDIQMPAGYGGMHIAKAKGQSKGLGLKSQINGPLKRYELDDTMPIASRRRGQGTKVLDFEPKLDVIKEEFDETLPIASSEEEAQSLCSMELLEAIVDHKKEYDQYDGPMDTEDKAPLGQQICRLS